MGAWSLYFLAKLGLYALQLIDLDWLLNLLFALALAWPLHRRWMRVTRLVVALPIAVALLYHDAYLPPFERIWSQVGIVASFSAEYLWELTQRFISLPVLGALAGMIVLYVLLQRRVRFATFAVLGLLAVPLLPQPGSVAAQAPVAQAGAGAQAGDNSAPLRLDQLNTALDAFYAAERGKMLALPSEGADSTPPFDLLLLSVCSLGWDDMDLFKMREAPLLSRFDVLFTQFNSAASYSGPAVLRLLHGTCGQGPQHGLYESQPDGCFLFQGLAQTGYKPALLMNHDGHFDNFAAQLRDQGGMGVQPEDNRGAAVAMNAFDGTPILSDYEVLSQWFNKRARAAPDQRYALLYNTITMHDGNRVPGLKSQLSENTFRPRLVKLFDDLERFFALVENSGRPTVIVLVPEHGAAVRGDAMQISGLRELPTPMITHVPAAVKLIGFKGLGPAGAKPLVVDKQSSYLALTTLIAGLMHGGAALESRGNLEALVRELPGTDWVSENEGTVLLRRGTQSFLRSPDGEWTAFTAR
jgi:cellulose synthase operon protein YhjU